MANATRVAELTAVLEAKQKFAEEGLNSIEVKGENVHIPQDTWDALQKNRDEVNEVKSLLADEYMGDEIKSFINGLGVSEHTDTDQLRQSVAMQVAASQGGMGSATQMKSLGEMFTDSEAWEEFKSTAGDTMRRAFELDTQDVTKHGTYGQKDVYAGMSGASHTTTHGFGRTQFDPMVPRAQRPTRVRDLFPVATTNANLIDFFRVLGFAENGGNGNAAPVADRVATEFGLKNKSNLTFNSAQAPVRTIAHWEAAHRNVLDDEPQLRATIDNELLYGLALVEDDQILNGDGTGENLLGLLNTPDVQTYTQTDDGGTPAAATELKSDALRRAATKAIIANYPPTGFVLNPYDWEDIELQKGGDLSSGDGQYMLFTNISVGTTQQVWRQPVVESPAMPEGTFVTGAWGIGAQLYDRQQASVRVAEQHADFFVRNAVAILVEERLAFAVKRPESFVIGSFFIPA